jgi:hypothetical protein
MISASSAREVAGSNPAVPPNPVPKGEGPFDKLRAGSGAPSLWLENGTTRQFDERPAAEAGLSLRDDFGGLEGLRSFRQASLRPFGFRFKG